jgi:hypothetical protein
MTQQQTLLLFTKVSVIDEHIASLRQMIIERGFDKSSLRPYVFATQFPDIICH